MPTTSTKKHRATEPLAADDGADLTGGAHRASRLPETVITLTLGTILIGLAVVMVLRG